MKSRLFGVSLGSTLFILMIVAVLASVRPVYVRVRQAVTEYENTLSEELREKTGLAFSYSSLSPSIFSYVSFRRIGIYDIDTGSRILAIKRAVLSYNIAGFFSGNLSVALKDLTISGVTVEYDAAVNSDVIGKIRRAVGNFRVGKNSGIADVSGESQPAIRKFEFPLDVIVRKCSVHYADKMQDVLLTLKKLTLRNLALSDGIAIETSGSVFYKTELLKTDGRASSVAAEIAVSGTFFPEFDGSSALVSLSGASGADYSISHLDMLVNYSSERIEMRTMRTVLPFSLFAQVDVAEKSLSFSGDFDRFNPLSLVSVRRKNELIRKAGEIMISGGFSCRFDRNTVFYSADMSADVPEQVAGMPFVLSFDFSGDKNRVDFSTVRAAGTTVDAEFSGSYDIAKRQPSGVLSLYNLVLKNGGVVSTELYIDPYKNGFMLFAPQIFMGEKSFTAVQLTVLPGSTSVDFQFELLDYSHSDYEQSGRISIDGSFLIGREKFVQAQVSVSDMFADSMIETAAFFMTASQSEALQMISSNAAPYIFTADAYISSDFTDFSFNAPYALIANTRKDRELLIFAIDGSNETLQISQFDLQFGNQTAHAEVSFEFSDSFRECTFFSELSVNSVPYNFSGNASSGWLYVSGDYNFEMNAFFSDTIEVDVGCVQFPFRVGEYIFAFSTRSEIKWSGNDGISAHIDSFDLNEPSAKIQFNPHLALSGTLNRYGFVFDTLSYTDSTSSLDGEGNFVWNLNDGIFDSIHVSVRANSPISLENLSVSADFTNPAQLPFSMDALKNDFYMAATASFVSFPASRLLPLQNPDNTISADFSASGTISNPFVSVMLHHASMVVAGYPLSASGSVFLDDEGLNASDVRCKWSVFDFTDIRADFDPDSFSGSMDCSVVISLLDKTIKAPIRVTVDGERPKKKFSVPDQYAVVFASKQISGDFFSQPFPAKLTAIHEPGKFEVNTENKDGFRATYYENGTFYAQCGTDSPVQLEVAGMIDGTDIDVSINGIHADMGYICSQVEIPFVHFSSGILRGTLRISGLITDPEYTGVFSVTNPSFLIPFISKNYLHAEKVIMTVAQSEGVVAPTFVSLGKGSATVEYRLEFKRWLPYSMDLKIAINEDEKVPLDLSFPFIHAKGLASGNLDLTFTIPYDVSLSGFVVADSTDVEVVATSLQNQFSLNNILASVPKAAKTNVNVDVDFDIVVGQKVQLLFNPFLRGVVAPGTPLSIKFDSDTGDFEFKGDVTLRGGEIVWLNRNFYMKNGRIVFNETQDVIDPEITVRAETRERDENGNMVSIILSAENQRVSAFNPIFSANPAKSEKDIMVLLGQVVSADSDNIASLAVAGGDYFVQATVMRRIENTLREMLNFDIFSIRTNVLQNSVKLGLDRDSSSKQISVGNFIDNSTVYIGKYFGNSLYVDSMLHWSYDEDKNDNGDSVNGIVFQPEIGFEMTSPFVNIRLGVAPDINSLQKGLLETWVPSTSMTLSWKLAF